MSQDIVILGGGGHCGVLIAHMPSSFRIQGICDPGIADARHALYDLPVWQKENDVVSRFAHDKVLLVNAVGSTESMKSRHDVYQFWKQKGYRFAGITASDAFIAKGSQIGEGTQILTRAIVETRTMIGDNCIINTAAQLNHDNRIGHSVHISPGAVLCGTVTVGDQTHIGAGAVVIQNVRIGSHCLIGAGAIVTRDVPDHSTIYPPRSTTKT